MDLDSVWHSATKNVPGAVGAFVAMGFLRGKTWWHNATSFVGGCACSVFASDYAAKLTGADAGLAGFVLGLFGMAIVSKLHETIAEFKLAEELARLLGRRGGGQ